MNQVEFIADQLQRSYDGDAWHGPAVRTLLAGLTAREAFTHPLPGAHSIWELVMHIGAWISAARRRLAGDPAQLTPEQDWPPLSGNSEEAWQKTLEALDHEHRRLQAAIRALPEASLENIVPGKQHSRAFLLHGVVQHNLYHAGQIAVLKKALAPEGRSIQALSETHSA